MPTVKQDQSKYRDADDVLRYSADDSEVFPGATGMRPGEKPQPLPGVFDLRRQLGRAPTVAEYRASRGFDR